MPFRGSRWRQLSAICRPLIPCAHMATLKAAALTPSAWSNSMPASSSHTCSTPAWKAIFRPPPASISERLGIDARPSLLRRRRNLDRVGRLDGAQQRDVVAVARQPRGHAAADRITEQVQVPDDVEDLVAHELVREAQRRVDHALVAHQDAVVETAAGAELAHHLEVLHEPEGAGGRDLALVGLEARQRELAALLADGRWVAQQVA